MATRYLTPIFAAACLLVLAPVRGWAADFEPDLEETIEWIAGDSAAAAAPKIPGGAPELTRHPMPAETIQGLLDEVPGHPFHDLKHPPQSRAWWKYPIYIAVGAPRDAVDSVFGFFSFWPIVNIPVVCVGYELAPTQIFIRDPRDWHRWPGARNKKGHGIYDWDKNVHEENGWGWFPTAHCMHFTYVSKRKVEKYKAENERLTAELQARNKRIEGVNRAIADRQGAARKNAIAAIDAGNGLEAVSWALPYHLAYPAEETAHAVALNALAVYGDQGPAWVKPYLWADASGAELRVLRQAETLIAKTQRDYPKSQTLLESLALVRTRLENYDGAMEAAQKAFNEDAKNTRNARLYFETALAARDEAAAAEALQALEAAGGTDTTSLKWRLALLGGKAGEVRPALAQLAEKSPDNPYIQYYLGCADLALVEESDDPQDATDTAVRSLERASDSARNGALQERAARALSFARSLAAKESNAPKREKKKRGLINLRPGNIK